MGYALVESENLGYSLIVGFKGGYFENDEDVFGLASKSGEEGYVDDEVGDEGGFEVARRTASEVFDPDTLGGVGGEEAENYFESVEDGIDVPVGGALISELRDKVFLEAHVGGVDEYLVDSESEDDEIENSFEIVVGEDDRELVEAENDVLDILVVDGVVIVVLGVLGTVESGGVVYDFVVVGAEKFAFSPIGAEFELLDNSFDAHDEPESDRFILQLVFDWSARVAAFEVDVLAFVFLVAVAIWRIFLGGTLVIAYVITLLFLLHTSSSFLVFLIHVAFGSPDI